MTTEILSPSAGQRQLKTIHATATLAHQPVLLASGKIAIPVESSDAGVENLFDFEVECLSCTKAAGQAWAGGADIYWNDTAKNFTTVTSGNTKAGYAVLDAASADITGQIYLTPSA